MTDIAINSQMGDSGPVQPASRPNLDKGFNPLTMILFFGILAAGLLFVAYSIYDDVDATGTRVTTFLPYLAAVRRAPDRARLRIRQRLPRHRQRGRDRDLHPLAAGRIRRDVVGLLQLPRRAACPRGAVAFGIVSLLPVELILQVGSSAGFAMVFALLIAAIIWNLGTWYLGLPASSSHTLIGSIIGVGIANALMRGRDGTSGVDWSKATEIGYALLLSPLFGFVMRRDPAAGAEVHRAQSGAVRSARRQQAAAARGSAAS